MNVTNLITIDQNTVEYAIIGQGYPVLALHGSPGGWDQMICEFSFLSENGFMVIAPSRPGYCGTPLSSGDTVNSQADLFAKLMEKLGFDRYAVVAWSGGGPSAIQLAAMRPGCVSALYLQACVTQSYHYSDQDKKEMEPFFKPFFWKVIQFITYCFPKKILEGMIQMSFSCTKTEADERIKKLIRTDKMILKYINALIGSMLPPSKRECGFRNDIKQFNNLDLPLSHIQCHTLIIHGKIDKSPTPDHAEFAAQKIKNSELKVLHNVPHIPRLSQEYFIIRDDILNFLNTVKN